MFKFLKSIFIALVVVCVCSAGFGGDVGYCELVNNDYLITINHQGATTAGMPDSVYLKYGVIWQKCIGGNWIGIDYMTTVPTKTGYTFGGYYTGVNGVGTQVVDSSGNFLQTEAALTAYDSDGTMYAKWNPKILTVTLNHQNATTTGTPATVYLKYGTGWHSNSGATTPITRMTRVPMRTNYTFGGYYTGTNGTGVQVIDANGDFKTTTAALKALTANGSIYAKWVATGVATPIYTITLDPNNGGLDVVSIIYEKQNVGFYSDSKARNAISASIFAASVNGGAGIGQPSPETNGMVFNGYWTSARGGGTQIINRQGELLVESDYFSANTTIYAQWDAVATLLDFDFEQGQNDCEVVDADVYAVYGENMPNIVCAPTPPPGYSFGGFYSREGVQYYDHYLSSVRPWDKRVDFYTLVAQYAPHNYKISYYCDNSYAVTDPVYFGGSYTFRSLNDVGCSTPHGQTFQHWLGDDGNTYDENETISNWGYTESLTLTPVFRGADYTITLDNASATTNGATTLYTTYNTNVYRDSARTQAMSFVTNPIAIPQRAYTVSYNAHGGNVSTTSANTSSVYNFDGYYNAANGNTQYIGFGGVDATVDGTDWCIWPETPGACDYTPMEPMDSNEWSVVYPYGEIIGQSFCSSQNGGSAGDWTYAGSVPGGSVQTAVQNEYTTSGGGINSTGDHCYCKLKAPNSNSSSWVYWGYMRPVGLVDCVTACPLACAYAAYGVDNAYDANGQAHATAFRTMLFSGLSASGMGYITDAGLTAGKGYSSNPNTWYAKWSGGSVTLPTPTYAGYTFNGWYDAATGGNLIGVGGASYTPTANTTLHAQWDVVSTTCAAGEYLPAATTVCEVCPVNNYCSGGTYNYNANAPQGMNACPVAHPYAPVGMWQSSQCGRILHVGTDMLYLHQSPANPTPHRLFARVGSAVYSANADLRDMNAATFPKMSYGATRGMHVMLTDNVGLQQVQREYLIHDDSVMPN